jgi:hypothetical protein
MFLKNVSNSAALEGIKLVDIFAPLATIFSGCAGSTPLKQSARPGTALSPMGTAIVPIGTIILRIGAVIAPTGRVVSPSAGRVQAFTGRYACLRGVFSGGAFKKSGPGGHHTASVSLSRKKSALRIYKKNQDLMSYNVPAVY